MKLIIIGIQGSGKGTQSKLISKEFNLKHLSTGDLIREEIKIGSDLGKKVKEYSDAGKLAPNELVEEILFKNLPADDYLLDGYPRNIEQAKKLENINAPDEIIFLELSDEEVYKRIGNRYSCKKCKIDYGLNNMPKKQWFCDKCGEEMHRRADDNDESIKIRIDAFKKETLPLLDFYSGNPRFPDSQIFEESKQKIHDGERVIRINGNQTVEDVFSDIKKSLN